MSNRINRAILSFILCGAVLLAGCGSEAAASAEATAAVNETDGSSAVTASVATMDTGAFFSTRDMDAGYDQSAAVPIRLSGDTALCSSSEVAIDGGEITLLAEGVYILSGTLTEGQVVVDAGDGDKVQVVLSGADITSASAAIYCREADKVFLTLAAGTENSLTNGGSFQPVGENNVDAVVFSKTDLTLNGSGSLTVTSPGGHGVVSKDELTITGGSYTVTAARHGLTGKDSVAIAGGSFTITSGSDGIHAENADDAAKGFLYIADGSFTIDAQGDAISASGNLQIDGGSFALTAGGGSDGVTMKAGDTVQRPGFRDFPAAGPSPDAADATEDAGSCKGIKADGALTVNGGSFDLDTADDAVHSGADVTITGGEWTIRTGDDGIHADAAVLIQAGNLTIPYCYEGVEGQSVTIDGGTLDITVRDDGINAAGGADGSGTAYGFGRQDPFAVDGSCAITVNGGEITIVSDGDCLDSNGSLTINGGTLKLTCSGNGNTAIDANGTYANNGGSITTNDGSESGTGGMGGGRGGMGGGRGDMNGEKPFGAEKAGGEGMPRGSGQQRPMPGAAA